MERSGFPIYQSYFKFQHLNIFLVEEKGLAWELGMVQGLFYLWVRSQWAVMLTAVLYVILSLREIKISEDLQECVMHINVSIHFTVGDKISSSQ